MFSAYSFLTQFETIAHTAFYITPFTTYFLMSFPFFHSSSTLSPSAEWGWALMSQLTGKSFVQFCLCQHKFPLSVKKNNPSSNLIQLQRRTDKHKRDIWTIRGRLLHTDWTFKHRCLLHPYKQTTLFSICINKMCLMIQAYMKTVKLLYSNHCVSLYQSNSWL